MQLSTRAQKYVQKLKRKSWQASSVTVDCYLRKQGVTPTPELLSFQANYSGLVLTIANDSSSTFEARLFSIQSVLLNKRLDFYEIQERYIFDCGYHATAQFNFFITDRGEICTWEEDDTLNILYSSFDKFIEAYAIRNELTEWYEKPEYYELTNIEALDAYVQEYSLLKECSDKYNSWWTNGKLVIHKGVWLDRPEYYLHFYAKSVLDSDKIELFKSLGILK